MTKFIKAPTPTLEFLVVMADGIFVLGDRTGLRDIIQEEYIKIFLLNSIIVFKNLTVLKKNIGV